MRTWSPERVAACAGAALLGGRPSGAGPGPARATVDSRAVARGDLFFGLPGTREHGGDHAAEALAAGAWGVLVSPDQASALPGSARGVVLAHERPLAALHALASSWRRELDARVVAVTGSTGKTSTKDILAALIGRERRLVASPANLNTEIGLPLAILGAPAGTEVLVLEMAMRAPGQIAELTEIARPDVGVIVNVGPVHLQTLGSLAAIAAAKAELLARLAPGATIVVPAGEALLEPYLRSDLRTVTFGEGGDVELLARKPAGEAVITDRTVDPPLGIRLRPSFAEAHNLRNLLAAVAAARALGITPGGDLTVSFSALRGQRRSLGDGVVLIDDCYNANPMSMRAAIEELAASAPGRRVAVLGDMLELGPDAPRFHRAVGAHASEQRVALLITVGPLAAEMAASFAGEAHSAPDATAAGKLLAKLLQEGDTVLVKGSRDVGLERVAQVLVSEAGHAGGSGPADPAAPDLPVVSPAAVASRRR
jgi:UDP-N-acetylmuramoyl-tripeptide--D-alanyl-D-alanine ligase